MSIKSVTIGEKNSLTDWDCYVGKDTTISFPEPKTTTVDIPGADNVIDLTEALTGDVKYNQRQITIVLYTIKKSKKWKSYISEIANYCHGQELKIIFSDDPGFYYLGRCEVNELETDVNVGKITIDVTADAYKYCLTSTTEEWLWDTFNFETDIIQELSEIEVDGELELYLYNLRMKVTPTITVSSDMTIEFDGETYELSEGSNQLLDIQLNEGANYVKITGKGTISIDYRGGSL